MFITSQAGLPWVRDQQFNGYKMLDLFLIVCVRVPFFQQRKSIDHSDPSVDRGVHALDRVMCPCFPALGDPESMQDRADKGLDAACQQIKMGSRSWVRFFSS